MARYGVNVATHRWFRNDPQHATAIVNIVGCLVIGVLAGRLANGQLQLSAPWRAFIFVGVLGGFTTFSSLGLDTLTLVQSGRIGFAVSNLVIQLVIGLGAVFAGYAAAVSMK